MQRLQRDDMQSCLVRSEHVQNERWFTTPCKKISGSSQIRAMHHHLDYLGFENPIHELTSQTGDQESEQVFFACMYMNYKSMAGGGLTCPGSEGDGMGSCAPIFTT